MAENLLEKAKRLNIQPSGETLVQKAQRLGIQPASKISEPGYFQRVGQSFQREGESISGAIKEGATALEKEALAIWPSTIPMPSGNIFDASSIFASYPGVT